MYNPDDTMPVSFRLDESDLGLLRALAAYLPASQTDVVRQGIRVLARKHKVTFNPNGATQAGAPSKRKGKKR